MDPTISAFGIPLTPGELQKVKEHERFLANREGRNQEILDCIREGRVPPPRFQFKPAPSINEQDLAIIRLLEGSGGWKRQSVAAKVRDGKLPPEYLTEFADLTDSPADEDDENGEGDQEQRDL